MLIRNYTSQKKMDQYFECTEWKKNTAKLEFHIWQKYL